MLRNLLFIFGLTFSLIQSSIADQQNDFDDLEGHSAFWVGLGLGNNQFGVVKSINLTLAREEHLFTVRYAKTDEWQFNVDGDYDNPARKMKEFAFLYGRYFKKGNFALTLSAGLAYLQGVDRGKNLQFRDYRAMHISTIGIPIGGEFMMNLSQSAGIAIQFGANMNREKMLSGVILKINVGSF